MSRKKKSHQRTTKVPGTPLLQNSVLPDGWEVYPKDSRFITPKEGAHQGVPMVQGSCLAELLGWPGPLTKGGHMNVTIRYVDGSTSNPATDPCACHPDVKVLKRDPSKRTSNGY